MVKVDLVTGFLGSGKTTFIRKYARYLASKNEKVCILENDYGAINVDMLLLDDLRKENIGLEMVVGGNDYDCHQRRFTTKLIMLAMLGYSRVIVEPSGIYDVDEFFDSLHEDKLSSMYSINNIITIVNSNLEDDLSKDESFLLASQVAISGRVILSHTSEYNDEKLSSTKAHINDSLKAIKCLRKLSDDDYIIKDIDDLNDSDFQQLNNAGYKEYGYQKDFSIENNNFSSLFFINLNLSKKELLDKINQLWENKEFGNIERVKGFVKENDSWIEINSISNKTSIKESNAGQDVLIVIGENLNKEKIDELFPSQFSTIRTK